MSDSRGEGERGGKSKKTDGQRARGRENERELELWGREAGRQGAERRPNE